MLDNSRPRFVAAAVIVGSLIIPSTGHAVDEGDLNETAYTAFVKARQTLSDLLPSFIPPYGDTSAAPTDHSAEVQPADPSGPGSLLNEHLERLASLASSDERYLAAAGSMDAASTSYAEGELESFATHGVQAGAALRALMERVGHAVDPAVPAALSNLAQAMRSVAEGLRDRLEGAGVDAETVGVADGLIQEGIALQSSEPDQAASKFGQSIHFGGPLLVFDVERWEARLRELLEGEVVGFSFALADRGILQTEGGWGSARTATDGAVPWHADKQMHVASVSKTITAIATVATLFANGRTPFDKIEPFLPSWWTRGPGVADLTFVDLLRHTSALDFVGGDAAGSEYANLQKAIATGRTPPAAQEYNNANLGLLRVILPRVDNPIWEVFLQTQQWPVPLADLILSPTFFEDVVRRYVLDPAGAQAGCAPVDGPAQTMGYNFPYNGETGWAASDYSYQCGGLGWHISAHDLLGVLAFTRHSDQILDRVGRAHFYGLQLGNWRFDTWAGAHYSHNGHWWRKGPPAQHRWACGITHAAKKEATLLVNSPMPPDPDWVESPCGALLDAFNEAWVWIQPG